MIFVDNAESRQASRYIREFYESRIRSTDLFASRLRDATPGPVKVCDATPHALEIPINPHQACIGEAAVCIDPISSQGGQAAIRSALQTAIAVHTILNRPQQTQAAVEFCQQRHDVTRLWHRRWSAQQYASAWPAQTNRFWIDRAKLAEPLKKQSNVVDMRPMPGDDAMVRISEQCEWLRRPAIEGGFITNKLALRTNLHPRPVAFLGQFPVEAVMRNLPGPATIGNVKASLYKFAFEKLGSPRSASQLSEQILKKLWRLGAFKLNC